MNTKNKKYQSFNRDYAGKKDYKNYETTPLLEKVLALVIFVIAASILAASLTH